MADRHAPLATGVASLVGESPVELSTGQAGDAYRLGVELYKAGALEACEVHLNQALELRHDFAEAHFYLGLVYRKQALLDDAAEALQLAASFKPQFAEAWFYLGVVAVDRRRYEEATAAFDCALSARPGYAEVYNALGMMCTQRKEFVAAAAHYRRAIELKPGSALAHSNLAFVILREEFDADAALAHVQTALSLAPQLAGAHINLAVILQFKGRCVEALAAAERAIELNPGAAEPVMVRAHALLMLGRFSDGWRDFEARKRTLQTFRVRRFPYPEWDGSPLAGKHLLVYYEQGLGDEIMFASCFNELLGQGPHCVIECSVKLEKLFRRSFPAATIQVADQARSDMSYLRTLPSMDFQVAAGSVPAHFRRQAADFPRHAGYLCADPARVAHWRARLEALGAGCKVGVSWRGGRQYTNSARRSVELAELRPLFELPDMVFVSVQHDDCEGELDRLSEQHGIRLHRWAEAIDDYDETAALVSALDLVISVQTAVIHLAGALGKPVWIMVPSTPEWRYMASSTTMPWYPSARLFRQQHAGDWEPVIAELTADLKLLNCEPRA